MDGFAVLDGLRALLPDRTIRVVAVSGFGRDEDRRRTRQAGFDGHLVKPVDVDAPVGGRRASAGTAGVVLGCARRAIPRHLTPGEGTMLMRRLGRTGLRVASICLGGNVFGWTIDEQASFAVLDAYVEAGGDFIDTADVYSRWAPGHTGGESETVLGNWLKARGNRSS